MQEPYGAYSWYAVNDQPSDKAFYDLTIDAPEADGGHRQRQPGVPDDGRRPHGHPLAPARARGVVPDHDRDRPLHRDPRHRAARPADHLLDPERPAGAGRGAALHAAGDRLPGGQGRALPVPDARRSCWCPSRSAMETQSTVTLGIGDYTLTRDVLVHELAHQWYGDEVTPDDWSDLWMNEGMATYLAEANWTADHQPGSLTVDPALLELPRRRMRGAVRSAGRLPPGLLRRGERLLHARADVGHDPAAPRRPDVLEAGGGRGREPTASPARTATPSPPGGARSPGRT